MNLIEKEMDLNDEPVQTMEDLNAYGERVYGFEYFAVCHLVILS